MKQVITVGNYQALFDNHLQHYVVSNSDAFLGTIGISLYNDNQFENVQDFDLYRLVNQCRKEIDNIVYLLN